MANCHTWRSSGYSRCITYLNCHNNNQAVTALGEFVGAVEKYGLLSRVRSDQGVENVDIARFMLNEPETGENRGNYITGRSVHNQRIKWLSRDVYYACTFKYCWLFRFIGKILAFLIQQTSSTCFAYTLFTSPAGGAVASWLVRSNP